MNHVSGGGVFCCIVLALSVGSVSALGQGIVDRTSAPYEYRFGKNPFSPSRALATFQGFLDPKTIPSAQYCSHCHSTVFHEWRESAHANSFREPFYLKNVQLLIDEKGIAFTRHCEGCHNPVALFSGSLTPRSTIDRSFDQDGITCAVCHSIIKVQDTAGTGSYVMGTPAAMVNEDGQPVVGEVSDELIFARPDLHKRAVMRDFYRTPEFCATCHKAALPKELNGYKWLRAFSVYDEWQQSAWANQSPLSFYRKGKETTCQDCHMPQVSSGADYGGQEGHLASHRWLGANTAIPAYFHYSEQLDKTREFLKGAVSIDIFGFSKGVRRNTRLIVLNDGQRFQLNAGEKITFEVVIHNSRIGHGFVPEQRDFYEAWCEFEVSDGAGTSIYHSGYINPDGRLESHAHTYETYLLSGEGKLLDRHQVWQARVRAYDNTILPGHADLVRYQLSIPAGAKSPLTVTARVNYRRFRQEFSEWALGTPISFPTALVAEDKKEISLGINDNSSGETSEEFRRWNNYGIALLDQQEYDHARDAFARASELSSDPIDADINLAVVALSDGRYDDAQKWLARALIKQPTDERARAYRGFGYRLQYRLDPAVADLKHTVEAFPRLSNARQELGYAYFLKGDLQNARLQYEALQQIDPDSLEARRYLSSIYSSLNLNSLASRESAAYAEELNDPAIAYLARSYWISHPLLAKEVIRSHVHGDESVNSIQRVLDDLLKTSLIWPSN